MRNKAYRLIALVLVLILVTQSVPVSASTSDSAPNFALNGEEANSSSSEATTDLDALGAEEQLEDASDDAKEDASGESVDDTSDNSKEDASGESVDDTSAEDNTTKDEPSESENGEEPSINAPEENGELTPQPETAPEKSEPVHKAPAMAPLADPEGPVETGEIHLQRTEDFVDLSKLPASYYQNATIIITRASGENFNLVGTEFAGFGSEEYPFMGTLIVTNGTTNDIVIPVDCTFFNYLDQSAHIEDGLFLQAGADISAPILVSNYVNTSGTTATNSISVKIDSMIKDEEDNTAFSFAGIVGEMAANTSLALSIDNKAAGLVLQLENEDNLGLFCNTMLSGSQLEINALSGTSDIMLSSSAGHVGGVVGYMANAATLTINTELSLVGSVEASGSGKSAGGLVGRADNAIINLNQQVTVNEKIYATGASCSGGYIGEATYNADAYTLNLENFKMEGAVLTGGNHSGGLFGVLKYEGSGSFVVNNIEITAVHSGSSWQFGGLVGIYTAKSLSAELCISGVEVTATETGTTDAAGGLIGFVGDNGSDGAVAGATGAYLKIKDSTAVVRGNAKILGGLIGELGKSSHFLDISGEINVSTSTGNIGGTYVGGLVGLSHAGVIRLSGATDLSGLRFDTAGAQYGQILGARGLNSELGTLVYALGSGNGDGESEYGWKFIRPTANMAVSDTGCYGEVIRLDGVKLTETKRTGGLVSPSSIASETEVVSFYTDSHKVIPCMLVTGDFTIRGVRDFVTAAIMIQYHGTTITPGSAFDKFGYSGTNLINRTITIDSGLTTLDLTNTGVVGLLRDDGNQVFGGTFNGNGCEIKLSAGQIYGVNASEAVGSGQLYNHACIGLLGVLNGQVKNLTMSGNIDFGMTNLGIDTYCGSIAGKVRAATIENVTVKTEINYHTGSSGSSIPASYVGGFFGATEQNSKTISFTGCSLQSDITNSCSAYMYYLGGYIGYIPNSSMVINVNDCAIRNVKLSAGPMPDAMMGGLVGSIDGTDQNRKLNVSNLEIDGLEIINTANTTSGGLLGYRFSGTSFKPYNVIIKNSVVDTKARFGGLVYDASGYWEIGESGLGISFESNNTFSGASSSGAPSALMLATGHIGDNATYFELLKNGLKINDGAANVTLTGGAYFDDLVGESKFGDGKNAIVSIGLTDAGAINATLLNNTAHNSWTNKCLVNGGHSYSNSKTRYYYNLDYYRQPGANDKSTLALSSGVDSEGDLVCWSAYVDSPSNIRTYFANSVGGNITGNIDLTGVSYYPVKYFLNISDATITFDYENINSYEISNNNKKLNDEDRQHYQMQTGLFIDIITVITTNINYETTFDIKNATLRGSFGPYTADKAGAIICSSAVGGDSTYKTIITMNGVVLDGLRCTDTSKPLLIGTLGSYTTVSVDSLHTTDAYTSGVETVYAASALMGVVGSETGKGINIDFSNIGIDTRIDVAAEKVYGTYHTVFTKAAFMDSFRYNDENSGGSYNFESSADYMTLGKEISNTSTGRNKYDDGITSQYCYFDTYGTDVYVVDTMGPGDSTRSLATRFAEGYIPYVGQPESEKYHELDINQRAFFIIDGCGTYGHPYEIKAVKDADGNALVSPANQLMAIRDILDGKGNGTVLMVNTAVLNAKTESADMHTSSGSLDNDALYIRSGNVWHEAEKNGNHFRKKNGGKTISADDMLCYVRNAYFEIFESFTLDLSIYNGIGGDGAKNAFSGVIVGHMMNNGEYPSVTLSTPNEKTVKGYEVGGLIRYSQGSVVKNLNIVIDSARLNVPAAAKTPAFFGGVIGWVIGGDNIIDNVTVTGINNAAVSITGNNNWLTAIGGYVGYVGSNDCLMGGGVIFRNTSSQGMNYVTYKNSESAPAVIVDVRKETDGLNPDTTDRYYWNPYVGRVLEGFACAEEDTCSLMASNTDKNYKIPKLNVDDKFSIENTEVSNAYKRTKAPIRSRMKVDSAQDLWIISSVVNSGAGCRATNDQLKTEADGNNQTVSNAYYYGRARTGKYNSVGTTLWSPEDERDESYNWGGIGEFWPTEVYLSTYTDNYDAMGLMTIDVGYREIILASGNYDLKPYGNGYRGIGATYFYDAATGNAHFALKLRMLRLAGQAFVCNNSTIDYYRHIYEYKVEPSKVFYDSKEHPFQARQAGLFNIYNQKNADGNVNNLSIHSEVTINQVVNRTADDKVRVGLGVFAGRTSYNYGNSLIFTNVKVLENSELSNAYYAGGFIGKIINQCENERTYTFKQCEVKDLTIKNAVQAGGLVGYNPKKFAVENSTIDGLKMITRNDNTACYMGGIAGQCLAQFSVKNSTVKNTEIYTPVGTKSDSFLGGIVGNLTGATSVLFENNKVDNIKIAALGHVGGIAGRLDANIKYVINKSEVTNSYIVTAAQDRYVGGLVGVFNNGSLSAFNVRSANNIVGYLITTNNKSQTVADTSLQSITEAGNVNLELLSTSNVGLRKDNTAGNYWTYEVLKEDSSKPLTGSYAGVWVGNGNKKDIKIVSASRLGEYSAVKNIGINQNANSYVIYADYTGTATEVGSICAASYVNVMPKGVNKGALKLTSDGACLIDGMPIGKLIINDTLANSYMKGYFGANEKRSLDTLVSEFNEKYSSVLSTYLTEETSSAYAGPDLPIIVLEMTSSAEINSLIKSYISVLTNWDQTAVAKYVSIAPTTYVYAGGTWSVADTQSMLVQNGSTLKVNPGKYDNTKNQLTIIDVAYQSPIEGSKDIYHLYIPVLVKKVMDISFDVKVDNGATGYASAYTGSNATLASFGEDYTAMLTYTYTWTAGEWNDALASGVDLLWSFDKQVNLDNLSPLDLSKFRLTLVDMNTHGTGKTFYQSSGSIIGPTGQLQFNDFTGFSSVPICDLIPMVEKEGTEDNLGGLKRVTADDASATLRRWDAEANEFIYYAARDEENDPENTVYYNVEIAESLKPESDYSVTETYYLVMNCTEGEGMYNKLITLGTNKLNGAVPSRVYSSGNAIYVLGDFYSLVNMSLRTESENSGSTVMHPGNNDYIDVTVTTDISVNSETLASYVNNRPVYYRYALHLTDELSNPVEIVAANTFITSLMIGTKELEETKNLEEVTEGYTLETSGSTTYITIKANGSEYIDKKISATVRYVYDDIVSLVAQFPVRVTESDNFGVKFSATSSMAYEYVALGNTNMSASRNEDKLYFTEESAVASLNYDSYNITSIDGNTSQLGLNGKESKAEYMKIKSRAIFDASTVSGLDRSDASSSRYPYYLEGTLSLGQKTETDKPNNGVGKTYRDVAIQKYLSNIEVSCGDAVVDTSSADLGAQEDGTYKFRIRLTAEQVEKLLVEKVLINIDYDVKTSELESIVDGQYANYKVTLKTVLKNSSLDDLCNEPSDYLIYTNARVYLGIIGVTDVDG